MHVVKGFAARANWFGFVFGKRDVRGKGQNWRVGMSSGNVSLDVQEQR